MILGTVVIAAIELWQHVHNLILFSWNTSLELAPVDIASLWILFTAFEYISADSYTIQDIE